MSFSLPTFNLVCAIYSYAVPLGLHRLVSECNLAFGRRVQQSWLSGGDFSSADGVNTQVLLLPAGTDIRSGLLVGEADIVEVPSGSSRWYQVLTVDDLGKGFDNEHRGAVIVQVSALTDPVRYAGLEWPVPMP
jgi:hypothetical protein